ERQVFSNFSVRDVLDETLTYCHGRLESSKIELKQVVDPDLVMYGKKVQISQILLNLLNNAIDALEGKSQKWIKVSSQEFNGFVEIRVEDSGEGVPEEIETKIMQPFFT